MLYAFFGWLNIALLAVITSPYWLRKLNGWFFHSKNKTFLRVLAFLRGLHKPLAVVLIASITVHGWLALGGFRLHTGTVLACSLLVTAALGLAHYLTKRRHRALLMAHKGFALLSVLLVAVHLLVPGLFSYF